MGQSRTVYCLAVVMFGIYVCKCRENDEQAVYVLTNVKNAASANKRLANFARMFDSVLRSARRRPVHWILLTQSPDVCVINNLVGKIIQGSAKIYDVIDVSHFQIIRQIIRRCPLIISTKSYHSS